MVAWRRKPSKYSHKAADAFKNGSHSYPVGAAIVKHKSIFDFLVADSSSERADNGVGGMIKRVPGFDTENGDWEYFYFDDPGKIEKGKIQSCIECHQEARDTDFVFGTWDRQPDA